MQLDFLQDEVQTAKEPAPKKPKRPQREYPVLEKKNVEVTEPLPPLPESLRAPFVDPETITEDSLAEETLEKSPGAFKTISETANFLGVPQHVLRFWESRFSQIKPLKLNGGRRYYRPQDIYILATIKNLHYKQGYTIKGAKKACMAERHIALPVAAPAHNAMEINSKEQLLVIRQELINLRDSLRSHIAK